MTLLQASRPGELSTAGKLAVYGALLLWSLVVFFPLYWVAITSFKQPVQVFGGPLYLPFVDFAPSLDAWRYVLVTTGADTLRPYVNSLIVATASTVLCSLVGSMAAYGLSRIAYRPTVASVLLLLASLALTVTLVLGAGLSLWWSLAAALVVFLVALRPLQRRFRSHLGNDDILFWIVSQRILPPVVSAIPIYLMFQRIGLLDTHLALIVAYMTVNLPIVIWLMVDFFDGIPRELEESAALDGASRFRIFFDLMLPLARPGLVATTLLVLILAWNEYLLALFLSTAHAQTMPLLVAAQNATRGPQWWTMSVLILLMIVPVMLVTLFLQRFIARGLLVGAVKG
ncbi:carbohydrate ABC transporter permease [Piscinibacter sp. XHJ-5]|uniref:carbohydrate ABC transporter permease n=1 Tax=Piscinibacter sp. XHJ-5 TaxID=3037797 RepID=UPI0024529ACC|nr:carbohydrate ABC transporter permease [Piscinibacter sp. XHJ-5]